MSSLAVRQISAISAQGTFSNSGSNRSGVGKLAIFNR